MTLTKECEMVRTWCEFETRICLSKPSETSSGMVGVTTLGFPSEIEQAMAAHMVCVVPRESGLLGRGSGCGGDSKALSPGRRA